MPCPTCGTALEFVGTDQQGVLCYACHQPVCAARDQSVRRWWESGTDFSMEAVSPPKKKGT
jgi:hypothetical protein